MMNAPSSTQKHRLLQRRANRKLQFTMTFSRLSILLCSAFLISGTHSFSTAPRAGNAVETSPSTSYIDRTKNPQWLDTLRYEGTPTFDVLAKTKEFAACTSYDEVEKFFDDDYVFRGPIIGPISAKEVRKAQEGFRVQDAYPDLQTRPFGFTIDPDNPYRCYFFERWEGTNTGSVKIGPAELPPTNEQVQLPTHIMSLNWTPEGKVIYACLSSPLDRFEGTTQGAGAVFGLLKGAGLNAGGSVSPGDPFLRLQQRLVHALGNFGRNWSYEEDIPKWWKSKSRGADPNDM